MGTKDTEVFSGKEWGSPEWIHKRQVQKRNTGFPFLNRTKGKEAQLNQPGRPDDTVWKEATAV